MQVVLILLGLTAFAMIFSGLIYGGFVLLQYLTFIPADKVFSYADAFNIGEYMTFGLIAAAIVVFILNSIGLIDINCLFKKKKA